MKFNFRKIASSAASLAMLSSTVGLALAANYPAPFVENGNADVALVYGASAASSDLVGAIDVTASLQSALSAQGGDSGGSTGGTITGEAFPLFTSASELFLNKSLSSVRKTITDTELPTVLADGDFSGDVDSGYEQRLEIGSAVTAPLVAYAQQPTNDDDPQTGVTLSNTCSASNCNYLYNATVIFDKAVEFNHTDSEGEDIDLFGRRYTVASATTNTKLVLLRSSQTIFLSAGGGNPNPSESVEIEGASYTIELVAATDGSATIKVTDSTGKTDQKEINEAASKKILGIEVSVKTADESTALNTISAEVSLGANKITLQTGNAVKVGSDDDVVDGTNVDFGGDGTQGTNNLTKLVIQVTAGDSDTDAIVPGQAFIDPVFESFKIDFVGLNVADDDPSREIIEVSPSSSKYMDVKFTTHEGDEGTFSYIENSTLTGSVLADDDLDRLIVQERGPVNRSGFVVLGNEDEGGLFEVTTISNSSSTTATDDNIELKNVFSGDTIKARITAEGTGDFTALGRTYNFNYYGASSISSEARRIRINYPDSANQDMILFPTIETSKGARLSFVERVQVNMTHWDGGSTGIYPNLAAESPPANNVTGFVFPDGDGYTTVVATVNATELNGIGNWTINSVYLDLQEGAIATTVNTTTFSIGKAQYTLRAVNGGLVDISYAAFDGGVGAEAEGNLTHQPAILIFEEKDDASNYETVLVEMDSGYDGNTAGIGIGEVERSWSRDGEWNEIRLESDSDLYREMDFFGTIIELDKSDSDEVSAKIWYPDEQVYALVYAAEETAAITGSSSSAGGATSLGSITVMDSDVSSVSSKNLIVIGGSCVNTVAASLLGSDRPMCGSAWTDNTGVGSGQFLIQTFDSPYTSGQVATLVAGTNAADTTNAATYFRTQNPVTDAGSKYTGTSSTSATLETTTA